MLDTRDAADGQLTADSTLADVARLDLNLLHPLTGPVRVEGAEPGDLLELEIEQIVPDSFGFTAITPGFGFLRDLFADPMLVRWHLHDGVAESADLPGVRIPGDPFLGIIGVAPDRSCCRGHSSGSPTRSAAVTSPRHRPTPPAASRPNSSGARVCAPTRPGRTAATSTSGSWVAAPGYSCRCSSTARCLGRRRPLRARRRRGVRPGIEMRSNVRLRVGLDRGGARRQHVTQTRFVYRDRPAPAGSGGREYFVAAGLSVDDVCGSLSENTTAAARNALIDMIEHLTQRGFTREQAYVVCSVAVDLRISQIVDIPHAIVSAFLPLDILV